MLVEYIYIICEDSNNIISNLSKEQIFIQTDIFSNLHNGPINDDDKDIYLF